MKGKMILPILLLAATSAVAETRVSIGIHVGGGYGHYPPPPVYVYQPPCPGPGYAWVPGYWYGAAPRYSWRSGYWAPPRYGGFYSSYGYRDYRAPGKHHRGHGHGSYRRGYRR